MRTALVLSLWLLAGISSLFAATDQAAEQLLATAMQQDDIFRDESGPLQLEIDFTAQLNVPSKGHATIRWAAKNRWWMKVDLGGFEEIRIQNGEWIYTVRNLGFTPMRVQELLSLVHFTPESAYIGKKAKQRVANGVQLVCVQAQTENNKHDSREFCVDSASHDVLTDTWELSPGGSERAFYSDYMDFAGHRYPRRLELEEGSSRVIKADVTNLAAAPFNEALLTPPKGAIERRHCAGMKAAVPMKQEDLPLIGVPGVSTVALTILADGTVGDMQLVGAGGQKIDEATMAALKQWKFRPAMCGAEPVVSDIEIVTSVTER